MRKGLKSWLLWYVAPLAFLTFGYLLFAAPAHAQLSAGNACNASSAAAVTSLTCTVSTSSGQLLVLIESNGGSVVNSIPTDSGGNTWTRLVDNTVGAATLSMFYVPNGASDTSITCKWASSVTNVTCVGFAVSGAATSSPVDGSAAVSSGTATNGSAGETSGSLTTTNANDILIYGVRLNGTATSWTAGSGYTIPANGSITAVRATALQYQIVSSTQSSVTTQITESGNTGGTFLTTFAAFQAAPSGSSPGANKREKYEQMEPRRR